MKILTKVLSVMTILLSLSAHASNCETHFYTKGKLSGQQDLGVIINKVNKQGLITQFTILGHGQEYPTYILKSKTQNSDGTYNLKFQRTENDYAGSKPMALAEGYEMIQNNTRISIKKLTLEDQEFKNVICSGRDE